MISIDEWQRWVWNLQVIVTLKNYQPMISIQQMAHTSHSWYLDSLNIHIHGLLKNNPNLDGFSMFFF